jgi:hypothetical protein
VLVAFGLETTVTAGGLLGPGIAQPSKAAATICAVVATEVGQTGLGATTVGVFTTELVLFVDVFDVVLEFDEFAQITTWLPTTAEPEEKAPTEDVVQAACAGGSKRIEAIKTVTASKEIFLIMR